MYLWPPFPLSLWPREEGGECPTPNQPPLSSLVIKDKDVSFCNFFLFIEPYIVFPFPFFFKD